MDDQILTNTDKVDLQIMCKPQNVKKNKISAGLGTNKSQNYKPQETHYDTLQQQQKISPILG